MRRRDIHPEDWKPTVQNYADIHKFVCNDLAGMAQEFGNDPIVHETIDLLYAFETVPASRTKSLIVNWFAGMYDAVDGEIEECYSDSEELLRLMHIVLRPDDLHERS